MAGKFGDGTVVLVRGRTHSEQSLGVDLIDTGLDLSFDSSYRRLSAFARSSTGSRLVVVRSQPIADYFA